MSFYNINKDTKLGTLHTNNTCNILAKYEILCDISANDIIREGDKRIVIKNYLLTIEMNGQRLFLATEQGSGKNISDIIIIKWIQNHYSTLITNKEKN